MSSAGAKILIRIGLIVIGMAIGLALGYGYGITRASSTTADDPDSHVDDAHDHEEPGHAHPHPGDDHEDEAEEDVLVLSAAAAENLELKIGPAEVSDHFRELLIPGRVKERAGRSDLSITAPVGGVVSEVLVVPGQSIQLDTPLFLLRVTDEELTAAQLKLLENVTRQNVVQRELKRLEPLTDSGVVLGKRRRELAYEIDQLAAEQENRLQELTLRGLSERQVERIVTESKLLREVIITAENQFSGEHAALSADDSYLVESLSISAGAAVKRGELLCDLADHRTLLIEGQAFETDLESLLKLKANDWGITAEFGHQQHGDHSHQYAETGLRISHLSSRVDPATQTFLFYLPITNIVVDETSNENGDRFKTWRFFPGQQVHLRVPVEKWDEQFKIPLDAVVQDGAEWFVYRQHLHGTPVSGEPLEFEPVAVRVLYRDDRFVILSPHGQLRPDEPIAQNNAYQLHQAFKMRSTAGVASHHGHEH